MTTNDTRNIVVLDPTAKIRDIRHAMASRMPDLRGQAVGFLWNHKPNGDILFARIEELLRQKYEVSRVVHLSKRSSSIPAPQEVLDEFASSVQGVIIGLGD